MDAELRAMINFLWLKGYRNPYLLSEIEDIYGHGVTTLATVERPTKAFSRGDSILSDSPRPIM
jgi:hypothetical protein